MFGRRRKKDQEALINEILRVQRLQGDAHSAIMNQQAAMITRVDKGFEEIHKRISFNTRLKP
ncbi:hypothetical protein QF038_001861 [Pseudarthrobacter sp. W1I19]|uniref:hypothetical protein n=1 Tax=Pseudarthrobacter sp. W1I19 TaxID=3042288 RepID=UPI002784E9CE|nr:hypothetical protein [Pseudarthrobacter sp. W1I19]MDQ0923353.1 hypothetical protein [Pseudarthrobacter sp. W1I19]